MNTGEGLHRFVDPVDDEVYLYSQFEVADSRRVFAVFEQPDLKATFTFTVTAPEHWTVVSTPPPRARAALDATGIGDVALRARRRGCRPTSPPSSPGRTTRAAGELTSADGRTIPLGVFCRARSPSTSTPTRSSTSPARASRFYEQAVRPPVPVREVRPAVRAGVQRRARWRTPAR